MTSQSITVADYCAALTSAAEKTYKGATGRHSPVALTATDPNDTARVTMTPYGGIELQMPALRPSGKLTKHETKMLTGYWLHEILGHCVHTEFDLMSQAKRIGLGQALNAFEDVRIEREIIKTGKYPNAKHYLETLTDSIVFDAVKTHDVVKLINSDPEKHILSAVAYYGRRDRLGYKIPSLPDRSGLKPEINALIEECLDAIDASKSTQDIFDFIKKRFPSSTPNNGQEGQGQEGQGQEGQGQEGQGQEGQGQEGQGQEGQGQEGQGQEGQGQGQEPNTDAQSASGVSSGGSLQIAGDKMEGVKSLPSSLENKEGKQSHTQKEQNTQALGEVSGFVKIKNAMKSPAELRKYWGYPPLNQQMDITGELKNIFPRVAKLRHDIKELAFSPERITMHHNLSLGRLDNRQSARMRGGATNVFKRREIDEGNEAAVHFLCDLSGSMIDPIYSRQGCGHTTRQKAAIGLAIHLAESVEAAGCKSVITGYGGSDNEQMMIKPHNKRVKACPIELSTAATMGMGGTHRTPNMLTAAKELIKIDASRHVLFVLGDGDCMYDCVPNVVSETNALIEQMGVEIVAMGLGEAISTQFKNRVDVMFLDDVATKGLGLVAKQLRKAA